MPSRKRPRSPAALYRRIFESLPLGLFAWQLEDPADPESLRLLASNAAAAEATGVPVELVIGKTITEAFPQAVPRGIAAELAQVAVTGQPRNLGEIVYGDARSTEGSYTVFAFPLPDRCVGVAFENVTRRELAEVTRDRREGLASLAYRALEACNALPSAVEAYRACLGVICDYAGWPVGHALVRAPGEAELRSAKLWHVEDGARFAAFRELSESLGFRKGVGLPGRVWDSRKPCWIIDVAADDNFPRAKLLPDIGLKGACGFPVIADDDVVAVLEFFSPESRVPDPDLLHVLEVLGRQLGFVVRRERK